MATTHRAFNVPSFHGPVFSFALYENENDNYNYESGSYVTIPITWNEATQTLTIGARQGNLLGMSTSRTFKVVWVSSGRGTGIANTTTADVQVPYNGGAVVVPVG